MFNHRKAAPETFKKEDNTEHSRYYLNYLPLSNLSNVDQL